MFLVLLNQVQYPYFVRSVFNINHTAYRVVSSLNYAKTYILSLKLMTDMY